MSLSLIEKAFSRAIRIVAGLGVTTVFAFNTVPHIFPQRTLQVIQNVPCSEYPKERYQNLLKEVCLEMNIDWKNIDLFYNNGFSAISGGCLHFPKECVIGLPRNYQYLTVDDVKKAPILFREKSINWDSNIGKALTEVLLVSDEQVKFLIAHELVHIRDIHFVALTLHATGFAYGFYKLGAIAAAQVKGSPGRFFLSQLVIWIIGLLLYKETRKKLSHWSEYKADEEAARIGLDYSNGGVECMRARLKLNRVLRKLHGDEGEKMFSKVGDNLIQTETHPKRSARLKRLKEIMQEMDKHSLDSSQ